MLFILNKHHERFRIVTRASELHLTKFLKIDTLLMGFYFIHTFNLKSYARGKRHSMEQQIIFSLNENNMKISRFNHIVIFFNQ